MILADLKCYDPKIYNGYLVPCGQCYACKLKKANDWSIRLHQEYLHHNNKCLFITFTYEDENLHYLNDVGYLSPEDKERFDSANYDLTKGVAVLSKRDIQLFNKRARHVLPPFSYFLVGEYGPTTLRPHYHGLYFGLDMSNYDKLQDLWKLGYTKIDLVSDGRISYVSKYSLLPTNLPELLKKRDYKPFLLCSRGLGISYLENPQTIAMHNKDDKLFFNDHGYKKGLPRYYRDKIFTEDKRAEFAQKYKERTNEMLNDAYELERDKDAFKTALKKRYDWVEQHKYHVEQKLLKKPKI